jgi:CBS domain-containing protein
MPARSIKEIVTRRAVVSASPLMNVREAAQLMANEKIGAVVIMDKGALVGIFTERDALVRVLARGLDPEATTLGDVMTADPVTIDARRPFKHALRMMVDGGFRHVPVVENGKVVGIVSARDALEPDAEGTGT